MNDEEFREQMRHWSALTGYDIYDLDAAEVQRRLGDEIPYTTDLNHAWELLMKLPRASRRDFGLNLPADAQTAALKICKTHLYVNHVIGMLQIMVAERPGVSIDKLRESLNVARDLIYELAGKIETAGVVTIVKDDEDWSLYPASPLVDAMEQIQSKREGEEQSE